MKNSSRLTLDEKVLELRHVVGQLTVQLQTESERVLKEQLTWDLIRLRQETAELDKIERELKKSRNKLTKLETELSYKNRNKNERN